jgi:hypothetical protein
VLAGDLGKAGAISSNNHPCGKFFPLMSLRGKSYCLPLLLLGCFSIHSSRALEAISAPALADQPSRIQAIALSLGDKPAAQGEFAVAALAEMALSLVAETDLARQQMQSLPQDGSLMRWIVAVERYIDELLRLSDVIDAGTPVSIAQGPDGLLLRVRGRSVMVSAPRSELQSSFEQRIVAQYCADYSCEKSVGNSSVSPTVSAAAPPRWSFSEGVGPSCHTDDGLVLQFETLKSLGQKRQFCMQIVGELRAIARGIAWEKARGVQLGWEYLAIHGIPGVDAYQLDLNQTGDSLQLAIPRSAAIPGLLAELKPWLQARSNSRQFTLVLQNAEDWYSPAQR